MLVCRPWKVQEGSGLNKCSKLQGRPGGKPKLHRNGNHNRVADAPERPGQSPGLEKKAFTRGPRATWQLEQLCREAERRRAVPRCPKLTETYPRRLKAVTGVKGASSEDWRLGGSSSVLNLTLKGLLLLVSAKKATINLLCFGLVRQSNMKLQGGVNTFYRHHNWFIMRQRMVS